MSELWSCWVVTWRSRKPKVLEKPQYEYFIEYFIDSLRDLGRIKITDNYGYLGDGVVLINIVTRDVVVYVKMRVDFKDVQHNTDDDYRLQGDLVNYILSDEKGELRRVINEIERIEIIEVMATQLACEWMDRNYDKVFRTEEDSIGTIIDIAGLALESVTHETVIRPKT